MILLEKKLIGFSVNIFAAVLVLSLSGCGYFFGSEGVFRDRGDEYLKAQPTTPIKIPEGSDGDRIGQLYVIPKIDNANESLPADFTVPKPLSSERMAEQRNQVKIQKLGDRRWIDINKAPGEVWPGVRGFLTENSINLASENPSAGVLETEWVLLKSAEVGSQTTREKYRIQLEPGLRTNATEIHVVQMEARNTNSERAEWPERSTTPDRETLFVKELAAFLAKDNASQASMVAQSIGSKEKKVRLVDSPEPALSLAIDYSRAWASVSGSLDRDGFHIDTSDRESGQWKVTYMPVEVSDEEESNSEEKDGVWTRIGNIFDFSSNQDAAVIQSYRVSLQKKSDQLVWVTIRDSNGQQLPRADADRLLRLIRVNLL